MHFKLLICIPYWPNTVSVYTSLFISIILLYISVMAVSIHIGVAIAFPNFQRNEDNNWW